MGHSQPGSPASGGGDPAGARSALAFAVLFGIGGGLSGIVRGSVPVTLSGIDGLGPRLGRLAAMRNLPCASAPFLSALPGATLGIEATLRVKAALALVGLLVIGWL